LEIFLDLFLKVRDDPGRYQKDDSLITAIPSDRQSNTLPNIDQSHPNPSYRIPIDRHLNKPQRPTSQAPPPKKS
jgi:hypothetical protein